MKNIKLQNIGVDSETAQRLADKNKKLIDMVIERAKRDFQDDIALIGLTGSFSTGDFHEKSDLDLVIVNNTDRGWEISSCFILDDVGYDIYCTPWETRLAQQAALDNPGVSSLTELHILYCAKPEYLEKFNNLRQQALETMAKPIGIECVKRAKKHLDLAKQGLADAMLAENIGAIRYASSGVLYNLVNCLVNLNNTCIKRGIKRYLEELLTYDYLPENFEKLYMSVIESKTIDDIRSSALALLKSVVQLYDRMNSDFSPKLIPTYDNLKGTYEELWCNCRNKVITSTIEKDKSYAFLAAMGAQDYLDEMATEHCGTQKSDLMKHFDAYNLDVFKDAFLKAMDEYRTEYDKVGRKVLAFNTFEELYDCYMGKECKA